MFIVPTASAENYMDFYKVASLFIMDDVDTTWNQTETDIAEKVKNLPDFTCKGYKTDVDGVYLLCKSGDKYVGRYKIWFYFENDTLLDAVEFKIVHPDLSAERNSIPDSVTIPGYFTALRDYFITNSKYPQSSRKIPIYHNIYSDETAVVRDCSGLGEKSLFCYSDDPKTEDNINYAIRYIFAIDKFAAYRSSIFDQEAEDEMNAKLNQRE